jgi:uncharacterized protein YggU (UPF0235/DUF167 family)
VYFKIEVSPEAKRPSVTRTPLGKFKVAVKEKAVGNLANRRALEALAAHLKVPPANLRIVTGHHAPHKLVHLRT